MATSSVPEFQTSSHSHGYQRSHRKVPNRLPLDGINSSYKELDGNGFLDHPGDDNAYESNGFVTPATSRFHSQDMSDLQGFSNPDPSHMYYSHSRSNSDAYGHAHTVAYDHTPVPTARPIFDSPYTHTKITSAFASLLISLPFVLSSLVQVSPFELAESKKELDGGGIRWKAQLQSRYLSFLGVCSLTAATLVTVGFVGELQAAKYKSSSKTQKSSRDRFFSLVSLKGIVERILSIGLPLYATSKLGGERVAIVTLMAFAAELTSKTLHANQDSMAGVWNAIQSRKWTFGALFLQLFADLTNLTTPSLPMQTLSGYLALLISVLILPWPFPASGTTVADGNADNGSRRNSNASTWEILGTSVPRSSLISSSYATDITVASGVLATVISFVVFVLSSQETQTLTVQLLLGGSIVAIASAISLLFADIRTLLPSTTRLALAFALGMSLLIQEVIDSHPLLPILFQFILILVSWACVCLDVKWSRSHIHGHESPQSWITKVILRQVEDMPLLYKIFSKKDSRRIVYFMSMNFAFMFIQGIWGYLTGSLGLLSDTVHMFFDCAALLVGLVATLLSEKQANLEYPHGYSKVDALAGFGNGVLLLAISVELVYEALDRIASGSQLNRLGELLIVSTGGLLVNVFGLFAFGHHGHSHSHSHSHSHDHDHDHGHEHSHGNGDLHAYRHKHDHKHSEKCHDHNDHIHVHKANHNHSHSTYYDAIPFANGGLLYSPAQASPSAASTPKTPALVKYEGPGHEHDHHNHHEHDHGHGHSHHHSHGGGSNMHGIYLHILADMMGSISVMISTVLVHYTGWAGWDALASVAISYFIIMATIPLVKETAKELVLDIPENKEFDLREALSGVGQLRGVVNITAPRFWLERKQTCGVMHVVAGKGADLDEVRERTIAYLKGKGMDVLVQVEREGEGRCWCGSANATTTRAS